MKTSPEEIEKLGPYLASVCKEYQNDRSLLEQQWLKNLRQNRGKYDPEVLARIDDERSHVYPRDTRIKVKGGVAKVMEMMFPSMERNWELGVSPMPSIPKSALQVIISTLTQTAEETGEPFTDEDIERAVVAFAKQRKDAMEREIEDQLSDAGVDHPQLCKRVVRSGFIYGFGVARAPRVRTQKERTWQPNVIGEYEAVEKTIKRPYGEYVRVWDFYPDLSAKEWADQDLVFERIVLSRHDLRNLIGVEPFKSAAIKAYLKEHPAGNYSPKTYDTELQNLASADNLSNRNTRRFEVFRALGFISAQILQAAGVEVKESEMADDIFADVWILDNTVIRAHKAGFGDRPADEYHAFIYTEDEDAGLTGVGLPEEVRDSQMSLCATTRALMDNMAATAGPVFEVNTDLLARGRKKIGAIHAFQVIEREGDGLTAQYPAVREINIKSHIPELLSIIAMQRQQLDIESNLPAYTMGGTPQPLGEAFRTSSNMSMMMGSANMVTKDTVRAFDKFTTSYIGAFLRWNMEFNEGIEKGDFNVVAKGNLSLVAKEVRGAALDQFVMTLTPEERAILDTYGLLTDRLKSRDLPTDRLLPRKEAEKVLEQLRAAQSQASQVEQGLTQAKTEDATASAQKKQMEAQMISASADATINEIISRITQNIAIAKSAEDKTQLENFKTMLDAARGGQ